MKRSPHHLPASLRYGCGLRVRECRSLRVKDLCFETHDRTVLDGKGNKDRVVPLPHPSHPAPARRESRRRGLLGNYVVA